MKIIEFYKLKTNINFPQWEAVNIKLHKEKLDKNTFKYIM